MYICQCCAQCKRHAREPTNNRPSIKIRRPVARSINLVPRCRETTPHQLINYKYSTGSSIIRRGYKIEFRKEIPLHRRSPFRILLLIIDSTFMKRKKKKKRKESSASNFVFKPENLRFAIRLYTVTARHVISVFLFFFLFSLNLQGCKFFSDCHVTRDLACNRVETEVNRSSRHPRPPRPVAYSLVDIHTR